MTYTRSETWTSSCEGITH